MIISDGKKIKCYNISADTIYAGKIVIVKGKKIILADYTNTDCNKYPLGYVLQNIEVAQYGEVLVEGTIQNINTSSYSEGSILYLGTSGNVTSTAPTPEIILASVSSSDSLSGAIYFKVFVSSGGGGTWGSITGTLSSQTDLQNALNAKFNNPTGTTSQYLRGDGSVATFPTIPTVGTWGALNYPTWSSGTPFVKMTAAGTFALDTNTYLSSISSSDVTTALGYTPVTNARTLSINGTSYDLSADRSWTIAMGGGILHGTASGTDTYTVTITGVTSYVDGDSYLVRFTNGNTTSATLNINSIGPVSLYRNNDGALIGGDIVAGGEMLCIYNSTLGGFQVIGTAPNTLLAYVTNAETTTITKGQVVYAFGGTGDRLTVKLAYNTGDSTSAQTVGLVVSTSIAANQKGLIMVNGLLDGLSILKPSDGWADGDAVYLGATAGTITRTKPVAPNHLVYLGFVTTASPGSAGRMYIRVQNGYELDELHDVQVGSYGTKDVLWRDTATNLWKNKDVFTLIGAASSSANGYLTSTDWSTFNGKENALTFSSPLSRATNTISIPAASSSVNGYLTSTDWSTFNGKGSGTVTSVSGTGSTAGLSLSGSVTTSGSLTLSGTLSTPVSTINDSTTVGQNLVKLTNPSAITFLRVNADNTVSTLDATTFRTAIGAGTSSTNGTVTSVAALTLGTSGTDLGSSVATGTTTPVITLNVPTASATNRGALSSTDWSTFNGKQDAITLTTTGTSGAATLVGSTLNVPIYAGAGSGTSFQTGTFAGATVGASSTVYATLTGGTFSGTENARITLIPQACTISRMYFATATTQPASGSLVVTLRKNNADTSLTITIAAGSVANYFNDTTNSVSFSAGQYASIKFQNNATGTSAQANAVALMVTI